MLGLCGWGGPTIYCQRGHVIKVEPVSTFNRPGPSNRAKVVLCFMQGPLEVILEGMLEQPGEVLPFHWGCENSVF